MQILRKAIVVVALIAACAPQAHAASRSVDLDLARQMAKAAEAEATAQQTTIVVTVIDGGGHVILLERMEHAQFASIDLAQKKATSALYYKRPTSSFESALKGGKIAVLALPNAMPAAGGVPCMVGRDVVAAIGVSGGNNAQDDLSAQAGLHVCEAALQDTASR